MSAFNIKGTTWHKAFKKSVFETKVTAIDDVDERSVGALRKAFAGVQLIIIDELSLINLEHLWEINIKLKIACNDTTRQKQKLFFLPCTEGPNKGIRFPQFLSGFQFIFSSASAAAQSKNAR